MRGSFDKRQQDAQSNYQSFSIKLVAVPMLVVVALIGMVVSHSAAVKWISDAAQAEFVGSDAVGADTATTIASPAHMAQPSKEIRTVEAH
ncbi:hypothetical protein MTX26_24495 [Bradyrhizobium sp. ISRA443]|uniref:hypothetical protein n=1 Tax=unclassified Bradyrhizobium TaxID=2631580 RepID=UPI002478A631|nr:MULTISPECIES: hypothetical protein [unclassified Bradyrhizobium]WGR93054.1 hypothetical protein MTX20_35415 [Bradyrhizobium sp. ISRA435]WGR97554.1 hypothetical protein MTX23_24490 [Bradyrhizobium sp. ISRA436]WGS04444.1 hypothetical protein MTX18_24495 [Bradyrhizobium sp. ISRA437]WGS11325.1 hypothetical protein MTX26_24495 [Bradyrhizobium sp. ISRA443]